MISLLMVLQLFLLKQLLLVLMNVMLLLQPSFQFLYQSPCILKHFDSLLSLNPELSLVLIL